MIIREILIFILLLQFSEANDIIECTQQKINASNFEIFQKSCVESCDSTGILLSKSMVCIPGWQRPLIQIPPAAASAVIVAEASKNLAGLTEVAGEVEPDLAPQKMKFPTKFRYLG